MIQKPPKTPSFPYAGGIGGAHPLLVRNRKSPTHEGRGAHPPDANDASRGTNVLRAEREQSLSTSKTGDKEWGGWGMAAPTPYPTYYSVWPTCVRRLYNTSIPRSSHPIRKRIYRGIGSIIYISLALQGFSKRLPRCSSYCVEW